MMAILIRADGTDEEVQPANGKSFTLEEAQKLVGGYVELLRIPDNIMLVNEEGKMRRLPQNDRASLIYMRAVVVGDVLVCKDSEFQ